MMIAPANDNNEINIYSELKVSKEAESYALTLEKMYTDVLSVPHFEDNEVMIDEWGISFFHKESQKEIEWVIITVMMTYINVTGNKISHVLTNDDFKYYATVQESCCLGKQVMMMRDENGQAQLRVNESGL